MKATHAAYSRHQDLSTLKSKRILVTGGTGFLGRHLTSALRELEPKALCSTGSRDLNLLEPGQIQQAFRRFRPDVVFHLAAVVGGIGANRRSPGRFFYENLKMGIDLLECARTFGVEKTVLVGTVCAYPKFTRVPFREDDLWLGYPEETNAPYGLAKKMLLVQSQAFRAEYGLNSIYLLPANLYGPGDHIDAEKSHVIPALIQKFHIAKRERLDSVELWGTGNATREFLHVRDAVRGLLLAADKYNASDPVNIGNGQEISIRETAQIISDCVGFNGRIIWNSKMPDGQPRRALDVSRARDQFDFSAGIAFKDGIRETIADVESRLSSSENENHLQTSETPSSDLQPDHQ